MDLDRVCARRLKRYLVNSNSDATCGCSLVWSKIQDRFEEGGLWFLRVRVCLLQLIVCLCPCFCTSIEAHSLILHLLHPNPYAGLFFVIRSVSFTFLEEISSKGRSAICVPVSERGVLHSNRTAKEGPVDA